MYGGIICHVMVFSCVFFFKQKTAYEMRISDWSSDVCSSDLLGALSFTCAFDMKVPANRRRDLHSLLAYVNEKALIGHFDYWVEEGMVVFRQALLLRGGLGATTEQIEDLMEIGLSACERFSPAFQFLGFGRAHV